jgi:type VI protein secretion system component VasK
MERTTAAWIWRTTRKTRSGTAKSASDYCRTGQPRARKRTRRRFYGCMYHHKRGGNVCRNGLLIRQERLDQVVLDAIAEALDEQLLARAVEKALQRLRRAPQRAKDRRATIQAELGLIEARVGRLVEEIARGYATDALRGQLQAEEQRQRALRGELEGLASQTDGARLDAGQLHRQLARKAAEVRALLGKNIPQTRQILRKLLVGRLTCEPFEERERRGYRFTGQGSYAPILPGEGGATVVVAPTGFEPVFQSRPRFRYVTQLVGQHSPLKSTTRLKHAIRPFAP